MSAFPREWVMNCAVCGPRYPWVRFGTCPTTCVFCGSFRTSARRVVR